MPPKGKKGNNSNVNVNGEVLSKYKQKKAIKNYFKRAKISRKYHPPKIIQKTDEYEIREAFAYSGDARVNTHKLTMPFYNNYWFKHIEKDSVTQPVRTELNNILKAADFKGNPVAAIADEIHGRLSQAVVFDNSINGRDANMHDMAAKFFKESYDAIGKANLNPKNRIIAAQNIADLMIKNYSPIAFVNGNDLDRYTDKYVVQNKALLKEQLEELNVENVDNIIHEVDVALANGFEYDQYEIKETVINSENESINTHTLNMPSYNNYWIERIEKDGVTQPVRAELNNILKAAGVKENDASAITDDIHGSLSQTVAFDNSIDRQNINMHDMAAKFFKDSYAAIDKANLSPKNRIIAAQNIADLMIKNYSPVAFVKRGELDQYTDKYVVQNKALLKDQLEKLNVQNLDSLIGWVEEALANGFQYDQSEPALAPDPVQNVNDEQHAANPEEELLKPRIPDFYPKLGERMDSADITRQVKDEIAYIIIEAGIADASRVAGLLETSYAFVKERINSIYDKETVPETKMSKDAPTFFRNAYESLNGSDLSTQSRIIAAQKIANVMLKNYSPVAFIEEGLEHYANDYVLNNRDVFKSQLEMLRLYNAEALMDDVDVARGVYARIDNEDTEFIKWLKGRINSPSVFGSVYNELSDILENAGFTKQDKLAELVRFTQSYGSGTIIDTPHLDGDNPNMHDIAVQFFEDSYQMIESAGLSPKDRIITAQKIADVMLKNYSPVATEREKFAQYANNYVLGNTTLLRERLEKLEAEDIDALIADRDIVSAAGPGKRIPDMVNGARLRENSSNFMLDGGRNDKANTNISNILKEAGIEEYAAQSLDVGEILDDAYSIKNISVASISMRDVAKNIFVSTYDALTKKDLAPNNKIETTQKIADVILKNYSPIIDNKKLDKYANSYVMGDKKLLRECLVSLNVPENEIKAIVEGENPEEKLEEEKPIDFDARVAVYTEKLKAFNSMYKVNLDANDLAFRVSEAWKSLRSNEEEKKVQGQKDIADIFKSILQPAFEVERNASYNEHRIPEFNEIIKSTNELLRSSMYAFTDLYHEPGSASLFEPTAFGGLDANTMARLTAGKSLWRMDQKSNEAWEIQSREAKDIADKWLEEDRPYEKMIKEMNDLVASLKKNGSYDRREVRLKLTAAEWLLVNNEKMMIEDPEDPLNPIPNWGNRYWRTITQTREALGIDKHTSMRDMIQGEYAAAAMAVNSVAYNEKQIKENVLDPTARAKCDSMELQKEQFAIQNAAVVLNKPPEENIADKYDMELNKVRISVEAENERKNMMLAPRVFSNFVVEKKTELNFSKAQNDR